MQTKRYTMRSTCALLILLFTALFAVPGMAKDSDQGTKDPLDDLRIDITPYVWLPNIDADSTIAGHTTKINLSIVDQFEDFEVFGTSGRIEIFKGDFGFIFDGLFMQLRKELTLRPTRDVPVSLDVNVKVSMQILDFLLAYRALEMPIDQSGSMALTCDAYGGIRYNALQQQAYLDFAAGPYQVGTKLGGTATWVDPVIGGRVIFGATEWLHLFTWADVAGFGIEGLSMSWNAVGGVDLQPASWASIKLAWKVYGLDYETGDGRDKFGIDGIYSGPWVGLDFHL